MKCPFCAKRSSRVLEKRESEDGLSNRRRRECLKCHKRWTTFEKAELPRLYVVKKDGRREEFSEEKLRRGIFKACEKCPVSAETIDGITNSIVADIFSQAKGKEIASSMIGEKVMAALRKTNQVAYIRFASVYREFADVSEFEHELEKLRSRIKRKTIA